VSGIFSRWQPIYAERGIATFPVKIDNKNRKVPMNKGYGRTGLRGSAELARKFTNAEAFGALLGPRNNLALLDVDTKDERALDDALSTYGDTPVISCTASGGGFHAWYRYSEEVWKHHGKSRRAVRPDPTKPFDFLAAGMAVVPPSKSILGQYEFIRGGLEGLDQLKPFARPVPSTRREGVVASFLPDLPAADGSRNNKTWRYAMRMAKSVTTFDQLVAEVVVYNERSLHHWKGMR